MTSSTAPAASDSLLQVATLPVDDWRCGVVLTTGMTNLCIGLSATTGVQNMGYGCHKKSSVVTHNFMKFGCVILEICAQTDRPRSSQYFSTLHGGERSSYTEDGDPPPCNHG